MGWVRYYTVTGAAWTPRAMIVTAWPVRGGVMGRISAIVSRQRQAFRMLNKLLYRLSGLAAGALGILAMFGDDVLIGAGILLVALSVGWLGNVVDGR